MVTKAAWRRRARQARITLRVDDPAHCDGLAAFLAGPERRPGWVVGYRAMAGEVDLGPLFERAGLGPFALTRTPPEGRVLTLHPLDACTERHPYGFDQPVAAAPVVPDAEVAVVLVPGLAFDRHGVRLGHGAGYYDRLLARLARRLDPVVLIGVTGGYIVAELPTEPHDVPMTHLAGAFGVAPVPLPEPVG